MPLIVRLLNALNQPMETVEPDGGFVDSILPRLKDERYKFLSVIDRQGDTFFNNLQARGFVVEWQSLDRSRLTTEQTRQFDRISALARRAEIEVLLLQFEAS